MLIFSLKVILLSPQYHAHPFNFITNYADLFIAQYSADVMAKPAGKVWGNNYLFERRDKVGAFSFSPPHKSPCTVT